MNIWETLGIDATSDMSKIKLAYAAKAKQYHPEENPEEYQLLRQAYKAALGCKNEESSGDRTDQIDQGDLAYRKVMLENPRIGRTRAERDSGGGRVSA